MTIRANVKMTKRAEREPNGVKTRQAMAKFKIMAETTSKFSKKG